MAETIPGWIHRTLRTHLGRIYPTIRPWFDADNPIFKKFLDDPNYEPLITSGCVLLVMWLICYWLYRQKIFVRI
jgi:heparan-alpha-glucosaminide N-acetyltransferase